MNKGLANKFSIDSEMKTLIVMFSIYYRFDKLLSHTSIHVQAIIYGTISYIPRSANRCIEKKSSKIIYPVKIIIFAKCLSFIIKKIIFLQLKVLWFFR